MTAAPKSLQHLRYEALLREHTHVGMKWATAQICCHQMLADLEALGWDETERLQALQELFRGTLAQISMRNAE